MPTLLEVEPGTDTDPFAEFIGGDNGAPAYQSVGGAFGEVPKAEINTPTDYGSFADLVPDPLTTGARTAGADDFGDFSDLVPPSPTGEAEKALAETPLVKLEKGLSAIAPPLAGLHDVMNSVRVFGSAAGKYIFHGLQGLEIETAKIMANPPPELTTPQAEAVLLPQDQQDALEKQYVAETQAAVPEAIARAEYWKARAEKADEQSEVDPALANTIPARLSAAAGHATVMGMESLIPGAGLPLMVMHGALATEAEAKNAGKTDAEAEQAAVRSAIGLGIFGGASKLAALGVAKLLPKVFADPSKLTTFVAQFTGQEAANETSSRAIGAWEAAANAPEGQKVKAAINALGEQTLEGAALNLVFAGMGAAKAAGRPGAKPAAEPGERATSPVSEPVRSPAPESGVVPETQRYVEPALRAEPVNREADVMPPVAETVPRETSAEKVPEYLRPDPELVRLINEPAAPAEATAPRLLRGEKQGDLISSTQAEPFALVGEKGVDFGKRKAETEAEAQAKEEARLKQESEQELLEDFRQHESVGGDEFIDALKAEGGLPAISSTRQTPFRGELQNIREELQNPNRQERIKYADIFRKNAPDEDALTHRMRARGFSVETPGDLLAMARERIRTGRPIFGSEVVGVGMFFEPGMEGGAFGSGGGRRTTVRPKGRTPRGDPNFLRVEPGWKRLGKGLERKGAADVIEETPNKVGKLLSNAMRKHVDTEQEIYGQLEAKLGKAMTGPGKAVAKAFDELEPYLAARENGRPVPRLSTKAQEILSAWEDVAESTGNLARANDVQVFDPVLGKHRQIGNLGRTYLPRVMKPEVERVMRDPKQNPTLWNNLVDAFAKHRGISDIEAAKELRAEAGRFSTNDYMGNLERARTGQLPEIFYDYDLRRVASRYIPSFSERMAQIIAYGQRLGPREQPQRENLWDIARKEAENDYTQRWLNSAEDQAVNLRAQNASGTGMARAQTLASGLLLSSPTTSVMRNTLSGLTSTAEVMGIRRSLAPIVQATRRAERSNAREMGAVRSDMGDFLHADQLGQSVVDDVVRAITDKALKFSGYNGSEVFVRTHGALTAAQFARDGVAAIAKKPGSMRGKEALAMFQRMGVDAKKIVAEKADWRAGAETRKFIRTVIRDTQGGYRFDQVPLWANSNMGRFFYQFGRWGTQRARNIWKNGIKPALGEEVEWNGKTMVRRDVRPLAKMAISSVLLGEAFAGVAAGLFGRDRRDASLEEISQAWDEDQKLAVGLATERAINDIIMAGTLGIWGQPIDWAKSLKNQSRLKNPTEPPGLASVNAMMELGQAAIDQEGTVTRADLLKFAGNVVPGPKQITDVARNVMDEPLYEAQNDVKTLRATAQRWARQQGMDVSPKSKGDFRKSPMAPEYEPIKEALLVGDAQTAKVLTDDFLSRQPDAKARGKARLSLKASIEASQPFRAGPYTARQHRVKFQAWARQNLSEADYLQTKRIQERYMKAAQAAGLW